MQYSDRLLDPPALLTLLADGRRHSAEQLAAALGLTHGEVAAAIVDLRARGIGIEAEDAAYRLPRAVEWLSAAAIRAAIDPARADRLRRLDVRFDVDSTNAQLLAAAAPPRGRADVLLSELQHAGRGRRGREWIAPFGASLALSVGWRFADASAADPALSLCVGACVLRALRRAGAAGVGVKWPNDLWFRDRKVGGILLEVHAQAGGSVHVVIGIGLNVFLSAGERAAIEAAGTRAAALAEACDRGPSRNFIAGAILDELLSMLADFERSGFDAWRAEWTAHDVLRDRTVRVVAGDSVIVGTARGVDPTGALVLERDGALRNIVSGEVSLRLQEDAS